MAFTMEQKIGPPGKHKAMLSEVQFVNGQFGPACRWVFAISDGPSHGMELLKLTGVDPRLGTNLGDLLASLYGRELRKGDTVDPASDLVGKSFEVFATPGSNGSGAVIQTVRPIADN